jgi:hypothetical protein
VSRGENCLCIAQKSALTVDWRRHRIGFWEPNMRRHSAVAAIFAGGAIAATLDIVFAFVYYGSHGVTPIRNLQSIASGLLGSAAFKGGVAAAALGLFAHFFILISAAAIFYLASRKLTWLVRQPVIAGVLYGVAIFLAMNLVIVPLSACPFKEAFPPSFPLLPTIRDLLVHTILVGLPIGLCNRTAYVRV